VYSGKHSPKISINTSPAHGINISSSFEVKRLFDNMKKDTDLIISAMDLTINECTEKKIESCISKGKNYEGHRHGKKIQSGINSI